MRDDKKKQADDILFSGAPSDQVTIRLLIGSDQFWKLVKGEILSEEISGLDVIDTKMG